MKAWKKITSLARLITKAIKSHEDEEFWEEIEGGIPPDLLQEMERSILEGGWGLQSGAVDYEDDQGREPEPDNEPEMHSDIDVAKLDDRTVVLLDRVNAERLMHLGELLNYPPSDVIVMALMVLNLHVNSKVKGDRVVIISREGKDFEFDI